jgi:hypothetical protein
VVGIADGIIEDVTFRGVNVTAAGGGTLADAAREVPERRNSSLEPSFMGTLPAHGLYARHVRNLSVVDCGFDTATPDARPAVVLENVNGAVVDRLTSPKPHAGAVRASAGSRKVTVGSVATSA